MTCGFLGKFTTCELGGLDYQVILIVFFFTTDAHRNSQSEIHYL